jgi:hypothetical protein
MMKKTLMIMAMALLLAGCGAETRYVVTGFGGSGWFTSEVQQKTVVENAETGEPEEVWTPISKQKFEIGADTVQVPLEIAQNPAYADGCIAFEEEGYGLCSCPVLIGSVSNGNLVYEHAGSLNLESIVTACVTRHGDASVGVIKVEE